jgi:hypothetical protein
MYDNSVKNPISALRCISRHCGVPQVRLIPRYLQALISAFLQSRLNVDFLRVHHISIFWFNVGKVTTKQSAGGIISIP